MRYRPEAKKFDENEKTAVQTYENREQIIKEIDTSISPYMKNQNQYF